VRKDKDFRVPERDWGVIDRLDVQADTQWTFEMAMAIAFGTHPKAEGFAELPGLGMTLFWLVKSGHDPVKIRVPMRTTSEQSTCTAEPWWDHGEYAHVYDEHKGRETAVRRYNTDYVRAHRLDSEVVVQPLPYPMGVAPATALAWEWLKQAEYEEDPDTDGDAKKGFRVWTPGPLRYNHYVITVITPTWIVYGK